MPTREASIAVIGGSGLYEMEGLADVETIDMDTPFGKPSDAIVLGSSGRGGGGLPTPATAGDTGSTLPKFRLRPTFMP